MISLRLQPISTPIRYVNADTFYYVIPTFFGMDAKGNNTRAKMREIWILTM